MFNLSLTSEEKKKSDSVTHFEYLKKKMLAYMGASVPLDLSMKLPTKECIQCSSHQKVQGRRVSIPPC